MEKLAIFDVDFTLTKKETLMELYKFVVFKNFKNIRFLPRALFSGLMYSVKVYDEKRFLYSFLKFIDKIQEEDLDNLAKEYYSKVLKKILYKDAIDMIKKLKNEGCKIYLISASPEFYLKELYDIKEVDVIIGNKFRVENGFFARKMDVLNCKGEEKVRRLKEYLQANNIEVDYKNSYMFSDSLSDKPLLDLVGNPYLINYKKKNDFKVLNWK